MPLSPKQKQFADEMKEMNDMGPLEALRSGLGSAGANAANVADQAKKALLQRMGTPTLRKQQNDRTPEEDLALRIKGAAAMQQSKDSEAQNTIKRLQGEIGESEAMQEFGEPVQDDMASKKEMLRKYLLNNR